MENWWIFNDPRLSTHTRGKVLWRKGGNPWPFGGSRANLLSEGGRLKIKRLKPSDAAVYKCQGCKDGVLLGDVWRS